MKRTVPFFAICLALVLLCGCKQGPTLAGLVDPMIGTAYNGHTFPGATVPFGMVSPSPDTGLNDWQHCAGYHHDDDWILGFSQTHMSGTGAPDMCDLLLMPVCGEPAFEPGDNTRKGYRAHFLHESESARPGYYAVTLDEDVIRCEMTASERCAFYRFTFQGPEQQPGLLFDMLHGNDGGIYEADVRCTDDRHIEGFRRSYGFISNHVWYFCAELSEPVAFWTGWADGHALEPGKASERMSKLHVAVPSQKPLLVRIGVSTVSCEAARANLHAELDGKSFGDIARAAALKWEEALSPIQASFASEEEARIFYTALYHAMVVPNLITDVDGSYRGWDKEVHRCPEGAFYTNYSLWDTYRAVHPLYNLICPERNVAFIRSMLERYRQIGMLPINEYGTCETFCMIGYHAVPVIADAILQDLGGFDYEEAWTAMKAIAEDPDRGVWPYKLFGYIPTGMDHSSVSKTLEYAYDDWCLSLVARKLGKSEEADYFAARAGNYANVFDPSVGFMRARNEDGSWKEPFSPLRTAAHDQDFIEGNAWQYTFYVPHDRARMVALYGGPEAFGAKLDEMFATTLSADDIVVPDITGLIGQYAHGNEPCHHVAYLYNDALQPWKTQEIVAQIKKEMYSDDLDGLCGNDDCGQMSAWYVWSALGFYPVCPGSGSFDIGSPSVRSATIALPGGHSFTIRTRTADGGQIGPEDIYIQSITQGGAPFTETTLALSDILAGGEMVFTMGPAPKES